MRVFTPSRVRATQVRLKVVLSGQTFLVTAQALAEKSKTELGLSDMTIDLTEKIKDQIQYFAGQPFLD